MNHKLGLGFMICWSMAAALCYGGGVSLDYGPKLLTPSRDVETPHIDWMQPSAQKPLKISYVAYRWGMRELVEISQRMDIEYNAVTVPDVGLFNPDTGLCESQLTTVMEQEMLDLAQQRLQQPCDLLILGKVNWTALPIELRYDILKKVKDGTPLLGVVTNPDEYWSKATAKPVAATNISFLYPFKGLPEYKKYNDFSELIKTNLHVFRFGKGLIYEMLPPRAYLNWSAHFQPLTPVHDYYTDLAKSDFRPIEYDYYQAFLCQLIRSAAGSIPETQISGSPYIRITNETDNTSVGYTLSGNLSGKYNCRFVVRSVYDEPMCATNREVELSANNPAVDFNAGRLGGGQYFADLWLMRKDKVVDFGSSYIEIIPARGVASIELNPSFKQAEHVAGLVRLKGNVNSSNLVVQVRNIDNYGRVTAVQRIPVNGLDAVPFSLPMIRQLSVVQYLFAELCDQDGRLDYKRALYSVSDLYPPDDVRYVLAICSAPGSYLWDKNYLYLSQNGIDTVIDKATIPVYLANLYNLPCLDRVIDIKSDWYALAAGGEKRRKDDHIRTPCLLDPEYLQKIDQIIAKVVKREKGLPTIEFNVGDECHFIGLSECELCFCDRCVAAFHVFLKDEYKTLEAMDREYQASYNSFDEVKPVTMADAKKDPRLIPLWVDYRRHMENTYAGIYRYSAQTVQKAIPGAKVGYEGSDTLVNSLKAADFHKLMRAMTLNNTYEGVFVPYAVSDFRQPGAMIGLGWYGGYTANRSPEFMRMVCWKELFRGANCFWVWESSPATETQLGYSVNAPDFSFYDYFKANLEAVSELKQGIGKQMIHSRRVNDKMAILYSAGSVHVATLTEGLPSMEQTLNSLLSLLEDCGTQFQVISYAQLAEGILKTGEFQYLVLPYAQALSDAEAAAVKTFVSEGGTVLADLRPGVRDEHGYADKKGRLDDLFGVEQNPQAASARRGKIQINEAGFAEDWPETFTDSGIKLAGGSSKGKAADTPVFIVNTCGKGRAVLLNFSLAEYAKVTGSLENSAVNSGAESSAYRRLWMALAKYCGLEPGLTVQGGNLEGLRSYRFADGPIGLLGILRNLPEAPIVYAQGRAKPLNKESFVFRLKEKKHIYDVREKKYLGYADEIKTEVEAGQAKLFSLLPYTVSEMKLAAPELLKRGEKLEYEVQLETRGGTAGNHVLRIEVIAPNGKEVACLGENIISEKGHYRGGVPIAFNDAPGEWRMRVRDVVSGVKAEQKFRVE